MKIAYGPPGAVGVKQLQYVGDDADYTSTNVTELAKPAAKVAAGVYVYALITGNRSLRLASLGVTAASLFVLLTSKPK